MDGAVQERFELRAFVLAVLNLVVVLTFNDNMPSYEAMLSMDKWLPTFRRFALASSSESATSL
jgi:hypothetical protein